MAVNRPRRTRKPERSGLGNVDENIKKNQERRNRNRPDWVKIGDGESVVVRIIHLDQFKDGPVHSVEFPAQRGGKSYYRDVMCLDADGDGTPCPGCRDELQRRFKFWAIVIERDAVKENSSGKQVGYEDKVKILSGGQRLAKELNKKHKRHSLDKRDIEISREGTEFDTEYEVEWMDEEDAPLSSADKKLVKQSTVDLARYTTVTDFDTFYDPPGTDKDAEDDDEDVGSKSLRRGSGFSERGRRSSKKRRPASRDEDEDEDIDDEDEDEDDDRPLKRRSSNSSSRSKINKSKSKPTGLSGLAAKKKPSSPKRRSNRR